MSRSPSSCHRPPSSCIRSMRFFQWHRDALLWKYLVFRSPSFNHVIFYCFLHIFSSPFSHRLTSLIASLCSANLKHKGSDCTNRDSFVFASQIFLLTSQKKLYSIFPVEFHSGGFWSWHKAYHLFHPWQLMTGIWLAYTPLCLHTSPQRGRVFFCWGQLGSFLVWRKIG